MPPVLVLLSLLVGALEVHAAPLDKGTRPEEMVTRCIVEVLSNALAKPNAPPIDPECKEILKKSSSTQHSLDETGEQKQYETRNIKDIDSLNKHQYESNEEVKQSHFLPGRENEEKWHHEEDTSKEKKDEEQKIVEDKEESTGHSKESDFVDDDKDDGDDEERGDHKNHNEKEIEKKDKSHHDDSQEAKHNIFDKTVHQTAKNVKEFSEEDEEPSRLEEITKRHPIILDSDKYHEAHSGEVSIEFDGDHKNQNEKEIEKKDKSHHDDLQQAKHNIFDKTVHQTAKSVNKFSEGDEAPSRLEEIMKRLSIILDSDKNHAANSGEVSIEFDGDHKNNNEKEIEKRYKSHHDDSQQAKHNIFDKTVHQTAKSVNEFSEGDEEPSHLEEIMERHPIILDSDKYHTAHSAEVSIESDDKEEDRKISNNKRHDDFVQRFLDYEEKSSNQEEKMNHVPSDKDTFHYRGQENHLKNNYEKRPHYERESSEESREKRYHHQDSEEEKDHHDSNDESNERELIGQHYEDKKHHLEIKRWASEKTAQSNYEQSNEDSEESKEEIEKRHRDDRLGKQELYRKLKHHFQDSEEDGSNKQDKKQQDKRRYIGDEIVDEMKRYYPDLSYQQNMRHYNEKNTENSNYPGNDKYKRHHSEEETRSFIKHGIPDDPFRWKNRYFENDNSEEERKRSLQTKNLFPDYDDYDLWGKKQFLDEINNEYGDKKNPFKIPKIEEKRQYDRMDELAQLLNYKKKSVEFPDFYDSEEIKKRHYNERNRLRQRPLTEEDKELENLAIMDLELQKIAEKLSNNRQG